VGAWRGGSCPSLALADEVGDGRLLRPRTDGVWGISQACSEPVSGDVGEAFGEVTAESVGCAGDGDGRGSPGEGVGADGAEHLVGVVLEIGVDLHVAVI